MQKTMKFVLIALAATLSGNSSFAQAQETKPEEPAKYVHLDFTIKELDNGKIVAARTYSTISSVGSTGGCSIRAGDKIPTATGTDKGNTSFTFLDVGTSIDCNSLKLVGNQLALHITADISNSVPDASKDGLPVIRQNRWVSSVIVPLGKATTLFSFEGTTTKRQTQLELAATMLP
jgi:hypothetical protein